MFQFLIDEAWLKLDISMLLVALGNPELYSARTLFAYNS